MSFRVCCGSYNRWRAVRVLALLVVLASWPRAASAKETITSFGLDLAASGRLTAGVETGLDWEVALSMGVLRMRDDWYRAYAVDFAYAFSDTLEFFSILPRVEFGLGEPRFNRKSAGHSAHAWVPYLAVAAGYGSGTVWDTEYIELYGSEEPVEVGIEGVPVYGAVGFRRIGGLALRLEAVGGAIFVISEDADLPEGDAPSVIPSIGVRFAFGADSFTYVWR